LRPAGIARIAPHTANPSICGIIKSSATISGKEMANASGAATPSFHLDDLEPGGIESLPVEKALRLVVIDGHTTGSAR
jgi:hypothetical protein